VVVCLLLLAHRSVIFAKGHLSCLFSPSTFIKLYMYCPACGSHPSVRPLTHPALSPQWRNEIRSSMCMGLEISGRLCRNRIWITAEHKSQHRSLLSREKFGEKPVAYTNQLYDKKA